MNNLNEATLTGRFTADPVLIKCVAWNDKAESLAKNGKKGRQILVKGSYHVSTNEKDGKVYKNSELWIDHYEFMDDKRPEKKDGAEGEAPAEAPANTDVPL